MYVYIDIYLYIYICISIYRLTKTFHNPKRNDTNNDFANLLEQPAQDQAESQPDQSVD